MDDEQAHPGAVEGGALAQVRERKRRVLRQKLSETATSMFLEHGFDHVRVSDVAAACGVSTKTVWNHFPTKEALLFDRGERLATVLRRAAHQPTDVLAAVTHCIDEEIDALTEPEPDPADSAASGHAALRDIHAFIALTRDSRTLQAATADRLEQLVRLTAKALAVENGEPAHSPRNQVTASAIISLWRLHLDALLRHADGRRPLAEVTSEARAEVRIGADMVARLTRQRDGRAPGGRARRAHREP